ncbi:hypothetical protein SLI_4370 [Streptomyces lividans 1326]|uniref:Uncharacterized protein n=1 Tax=Streptomyces lividans 1326 TaxID=1200984 RepID=A0A7U9DS22_STRLI|nr:hypothetical protein SLI_4370 [Streptomyces lividans 1326]
MKPCPELRRLSLFDNVCVIIQWSVERINGDRAFLLTYG